MIFVKIKKMDVMKILLIYMHYICWTEYLALQKCLQLLESILLDMFTTLSVIESVDNSTRARGCRTDSNLVDVFKNELYLC